MMKVNAVLFDLDGTLIDNSLATSKIYEILPERLCTILKRYGVQCDKTDLRDELRLLNRRMCLEGKYDRDLWWLTMLKAHCQSIQPSPTLLRDLTLEYWRLFETLGKPFPDAVETLTYLAYLDYKLGLVSETDGLEGEKRRRLEIHSSVARFFPMTLISGEDTDKTKIHSEPFVLAAARVNVKPENCMYVGDSPLIDVQGAAKAGMVTVLVYRGEWEKEVYPDYVITALSDLKKIL